jgi:hypothetical protein
MSNIAQFAAYAAAFENDDWTEVGPFFAEEAIYPNQEFDEAIKTEERALEIAPEIEAFQSQLEKFREAKANESGG